MKREVSYEEELGSFAITCPKYPLLPAFDALGQKRSACVAGMVTNSQDHRPIAICRHYVEDSIAIGENKILNIQCLKEDQL